MSEAALYRWDDMPKDELSPDLSRRFVAGDRAMVAQVFLKKGTVVPVHAHESEQIAYILEGGLRFWLGEADEEVFDVMAGQVLCIPSNVPHRAEALEDTLDVDIFSPPRQDWIDGTDAYFPRST